MRALSDDLLAVVALVAAAGLVFLGPLQDVVLLRVLVGLPFLLFAPGYALVAALFPEAQADPRHGSTGGPPTYTTGGDAGERRDRRRLGRLRDHGIDGVERSVLSVALSVAVVPLVAVVLDVTMWGIRLAPVFVAVSALTLACVGLAVLRRLRLSPPDRFSVSLGTPATLLATPELSGRTDFALNALVVASVLFAVGGVGYAVETPPEGDTAFALLTENETGALTAEEYPTSFERGQSKPVVLDIENAENEPVSYTVVVEFQRVDRSGDAISVVEERELDRLSPSVADGETWRRNYLVEPPFAGEDLRLAFLLYRGAPPENPTVENAYRNVQLWVSVSGSGA